ncbi:APC family permease [Parasphingorhabdus pacifica]
MTEHVKEQVGSRAERSRLRSGSVAAPIALSGMLGAGLFMGPAPASSAAGWLLLAGLPIAAITAVCSALVLAHQSAVYRGTGPAYACIRARMGVVPARMGASAEIVGRVAAMAAVAETAATYLLPRSTQGVAAAAILLVVLAATAGMRNVGAGSWGWAVFSLGTALAVVVVCFAIEPATAPDHAHPHGDNAVGITGAAGVLCFTFLGLDRLIAPGRERDRFDWRSMRRSVITSVLVTTLMLALVGGALLYQLGPHRLALSPAPVFDVLGAAAAGDLRGPIGAAIAVTMIPVLLGVLESVRSTGLALVFDRELPAVLGRTGPNGTPYLLDVLTGVMAVVVVLVTGPVEALTVAVCCLLVHQAFASAAGRVLLADGRKWAMRAACLGMGLSVVLAMSMPIAAMLTTAAALLLGPLCAGAYSRRWS